MAHSSPWFNRSISLRLLLVLPFVLQIAIAVGLTGWLSFRSGEQAVEDLSGQLRGEVGARIRQHLDAELMIAHQLNRINLDLLQSDRLDGEDLPDLGQHFWQQLQQFDQMGVIYYGQADGRFIAAQRGLEGEFLFVKRELPPSDAEVFSADDQGGLAEQVSIIPNFIDIRERPWYTAGVDQGTFTWGDIFALQVVPRIDLPASVPVLSADGNLEGVLGNNLALTSLSDFLQDLTIGQSGQALILERSGELVASSRLPQPFEIDNDGQTQRLLAAESDDDVLRATVQHLQQQFRSLDQITAVQQLDVTLGGDRQFIDVLPYRDVHGLDWLIVVIVPEADFMATIHANTRRTILLCLAALVLATYSSTLTARWLNRSLLTLNRAAQQIADGQLTTEIKGSRIQELAELGQAFTQMGHNLQTSFHQLQVLNQALQNSESRLTQFLEALPVGVVVFDPASCLIYVNPVGRKILSGHVGTTEADLSALEQRLIYQLDQPHAQSLQDVLAKPTLAGQALHITDIELRRDGQVITVAVQTMPIWDEQGNIAYAIAGFQDISDRRAIELALKHSETRFRAIAANVPGAILRYVLHPDGTDSVPYISPSCEYLWEVDADAVRQNPELLWRPVHSDDLPRIQQSIVESARTLHSWSEEWRIMTPSGQLKWIQAVGQPERRPDGCTVWDTLVLDVSDRKRAEEQLIYNALHDSLTDLPNRKYLMEQLRQKLRRTAQLGLPHVQFALLFLDLDRFKVVNDSLGHLAGDQLLIQVAQVLLAIVDGQGTVARLGGDEFVIVLDSINTSDDVVHLANQILTVFRSPLSLDGREITLSTSIGIVFGSATYRHASDLIRDADIALYQAKSKGRARYQIFDSAMHTQVVKRLHLENDLRRAIARQQFLVYYQPLVALETGELIGFEALVRWQHPVRGRIPPDDFIPIAEETGLVVPLDRWVLRTTCQQLASWNERFQDAKQLKVSVNLSALDLRDPHLLPDVIDILAQTGIQSHCLNLELTESMLVDNVGDTIALLLQLKQQGLQISIDDFGTGYSSLSYLYQLPVDTLKIDRSFVHQMQQGDRNHKIVETIVNLTNQLGIAAIAEGIDCLEQIDLLRQLGCELGQGYFFAQPMAAQDVEAFITQHYFRY
ncbi:EAL domain-containing protein [Leptolyngbya sp. CCY15150]|uniref:bifunctional diguanylate cyclase/phosphodiesterase n=1 Tax=Leptolyngbya sp. CCY15150 TaxID=2767772 RepID=UPI001951C5EF|nr:EAL domain-containing protein [Leptolyngbya sp. CCY15150]